MEGTPTSTGGAGRQQTAIARHDRLVGALCRRLAEPGAQAPLRIDTHISSVIVTADRAYKLKKPVALDFVDFTDAATRRACCETEVRLNRRLAPDLYLGVVPIEGTIEDPRVGEPDPLDAEPARRTTTSAGEPLEYAVLMRAFAQSAIWENRVPAGEVDAAEARALGATIGVFHRERARRLADNPAGSSAAVRARIAACLATLASVAPAAGIARETIAALERESDARFARLAGAIDARNRDGFVRDCHGDLHLGNVATIGQRAIPFDCLEFDPALRAIDVASEIAFLFMDLRHAGRTDLGFAFLDGWLAETGDFAAVPLLDAYCTYRAVVRAMVAAIRAGQQGRDADAARAACAGYLRLAEAVGQPRRPVLVAMHGLSGSGKTVLSEAISAQIGAIRVRSDLERKRDRELAPTDRSGAGGAMYTPAARDAVYARLAQIARPILQAGWSVVVDASFLARAQRERFAALAGRTGARFAIADVQAPEALLRERLAARAARGDDASDAGPAVLDLQLRTHEALGPDEQALAVVHRAGDPLTPQAIASTWRALTGTDGD